MHTADDGHSAEKGRNQFRQIRYVCVVFICAADSSCLYRIAFDGACVWRLLRALAAVVR